jgi:hypothetical protein
MGFYIRIEISNQTKASLCVNQEGTRACGAWGGGERPHNIFLAKSVDETMAFSKRLARIFRLAAGHRILV